MPRGGQKLCPVVGQGAQVGGGGNFARASRAQALLIIPPLANFSSMPLYIYM